MVTVRCSSALYRALGEHRAFERVAGRERPVRLGDWAAILVDEALVVAIEKSTTLTLVFRLRPLAGFRDRFAAALRRELRDLRVAPAAIELECRSVYEATLVRRRNPELAEALEFAEVEAGAHAGEGQDEESVQDMLNEYPYGECPASCPKEAVSMLFGVRAKAGAGRPENHAGPDRG